MTNQKHSDAILLRKKFEKSGIAPDQIRHSDLKGFYAGFENLVARKNIVLPEIQGNDNFVSPAPLVAIIVETRRHFNLVKIVQQVYEALKVPIQIFHGLDNREFILKSALRQLIENGDVHLTQIKSSQFDSTTYNRTFMGRNFWDAVIGRQKVLTFQTDAMLMPRSPHKIESFLHFDYIGSDWPRTRPVGIVADGGNGGLSLRDWPKTVACIEKFGDQNIEWGEDTFFAFHMELMGANIAKAKDCARFSSQMKFNKHSFGIHKLDLMSPKDRARILIANPRAWRILPRVRQLHRN